MSVCHVAANHGQPGCDISEILWLQFTVLYTVSHIWLTVTGIMSPEGFSTGSIHGKDARERKSKHDASSIREAEAKSRDKYQPDVLTLCVVIR